MDFTGAFLMFIVLQFINCTSKMSLDSLFKTREKEPMKKESLQGLLLHEDRLDRKPVCPTVHMAASV